MINRSQINLLEYLDSPADSSHDCLVVDFSYGPDTFEKAYRKAEVLEMLEGRILSLDAKLYSPV